MLRYAASLVRKRDEEAAYRIYMTDTVQLLSENLARAVSGSYVSVRYSDIVRPAPRDTRTEEEKFYDVIASLGFKVVG